MCWGRMPGGTCVGGLSPQTTVQEEPVISRELLRAVCEPFFEQMLSALQQTLLEQQREQVKSQCQGHQSSGPVQRMMQVGPTLDEESTDIDEFGACTSLLSEISSEAETGDCASEKLNIDEVTVAFPESCAQSPEPSEQGDQYGDHEKINVVAAPNSDSNAKCGEISGVESSGMKTTSSLIDALDEIEARRMSFIQELDERDKPAEARRSKALELIEWIEARRSKAGC